MVSGTPAGFVGWLKAFTNLARLVASVAPVGWVGCLTPYGPNLARLVPLVTPVGLTVWRKQGTQLASQPLLKFVVVLNILLALQVCRTAWIILAGVSNDRFVQLARTTKQQASQHVVCSTRRHTFCKVRVGKVTAHAERWMREFFSPEVGVVDVIPNPRGSLEQRHLPPYCTFTTVFNMYVSESVGHAHGERPTNNFFFPYLPLVYVFC